MSRSKQNSTATAPRSDLPPDRASRCWLPRRRRRWAELRHCRSAWRVLGCVLLLLPVGCFREMADQPRYEPLEGSSFFADGQASRPVVPGTVAQGQLRLDEALYTGKVAGEPVNEFPLPVTRDVLARGQQRYNIFCSNCHDRIGNGQGMIVRRGFPRPPAYHIERLREAPVGHLFDVITNGIGRMPDLRARIQPDDRWAIVAYVRALQLSQHAMRSQLTPDDIQQLSQPPETESTLEQPSSDGCE